MQEQVSSSEDQSGAAGGGNNNPTHSRVSEQVTGRTEGREDCKQKKSFLNLRKFLETRKKKKIAVEQTV